MFLTEDRMKAIRFQRPDSIPVRVGLLPATWMVHRERLDALVRRHPTIFPGYQGKGSYDEIGQESYHAGDHVDEWGCVWSNVHDGMEAIVTHHPVPTRADVWTLKPPARPTGWLRHGFMYLRLADLRGFEELMLDFAEDPPELQRLIDLVLENNLRDLEMILERKPDWYWFGDDLGMQTGLAMGPAKWRKYLKPCFTRIFARWKEGTGGAPAYLHTDGCIHEIIPDLIDCGVDVINPQIRANGLDNLERVAKGRVCIDLDLDRQMFPFATPRQIDRHIEECVARLGSPEGGLWLVAECGPDVPIENIEAICRALEKYRTCQ